MDRVQWLSESLPRDLQGLEIGPLDRPLLQRPEFAVAYADHLDQAGLREKYALHPGVDCERIPEINFVIGADGLKAAIGPDADRFRYLVASHVIEHLPNPIGWLQDAFDLLADDGCVVLAIPDHRYCFDALRRTTTPGEWVEASLSDHRRPSPGRIFDALYNEVKYNDTIAWDSSADPARFRRSRTAQHALEIARHFTRNQEYFDVHCWTFTPSSFCNLMRDLTLAGLVQFALEAITPTHGCEFLVRLGKQTQASASLRAATYPAAGGHYERLPEGFDAVGYCRANPDVDAALVDPNDHYLEYGAYEGRRWR